MSAKLSLHCTTCISSAQPKFWVRNHETPTKNESRSNWLEGICEYYASIGGNVEEANELTNVDYHVQISMEHRLQNKKRKRSKEFETYINWDFVLDSVSEEERLCSVAKLVLTDGRKGMTPLSFQAIIFPKINQSYWNE